MTASLDQQQQQMLPPDENRAASTIGITVTFLALSTVSVFLRLASRLHHKRLGWDDAWIAFSWAVGVVITVFVWIAIHYGYGRHLIYVSEQAPTILKWTIWAEVFSALGPATVKISVCIFVLRMIDRTTPYVRWIIYAILGLVVPFTVAVFVLLAVQCVPLSAVWNREERATAMCVNPHVLSHTVTAYSAVGAASDFLTSLLPIFVIAGLKMNMRRKVSLCMIVGLGFAITVFGVLKATSTAYANPDSTWALVPITNWVALEHLGGILVACLPTLMPIFTWVHEKLGSSFGYLKTHAGRVTSFRTSSSGYVRRRSSFGATSDTAGDLEAGRKGRRVSRNASIKMAETNNMNDNMIRVQTTLASWTEKSGEAGASVAWQQGPAPPRS